MVLSATMNDTVSGKLPAGSRALPHARTHTLCTDLAVSLPVDRDRYARKILVLLAAPLQCLLAL